jgi:hypothetical protein
MKGARGSRAAAQVDVRQPMLAAGLGQEGHRAHDRAGDELREERDEEGEVQEAALRGQRAPVDLDGVAEALEGVEADAVGQEDAQRLPARREAQGVEQRADVLLEEAVVLEEGEHAEVRRQARQQPGAARARAAGVLDAEPHPPVEQRAEPEQRRKPPAGGQLAEGAGEELREELQRISDEEAGVEGVARDEQPQLARPLGAQRPVHAEDQREDPDEAQLHEQDRSRQLAAAREELRHGARSPSSAASSSRASRRE